MPRYFRPRNYAAGFKSRRASAVAKARTAVSLAPRKTTAFNKPVYRKLKAPRRTARTKTGRNTNAITTLARQVKMLQNQRFGEIQTHTQYALLQGDNMPASTRPIAFLLNNFYEQTIYKGVVVNQLASYQPGAALVRQTYQSDLDDEYEWNARRNTDEVSPVEYKPVYTRLRLSFDATMAGLTFPGKVRITILKVKPYDTSNKLNVSLPAALGAYRYLAERDYDPKRNYFEKKYHDVVYDKWITFNGSNRTGAETSVLRKAITISWRYKDMVHKPDLTNNPVGARRSGRTHLSVNSTGCWYLPMNTFPAGSIPWN